MVTEKKREIWVDNVKVVACILVVLGHFYQSMVKAELASDSAFYQWFDSTIYYFHVPLFFICSGYLYQKYSAVGSFKSWVINVLNKLIALGIPYFVFSLCTWILKKVFSSSVNSQAGGLLYTLFGHPASPYWYLYILFVLFVITVKTKSRGQQALLIVLSLTLRLIRCFGIETGIYFADRVMENWIWFVLGMSLVHDMIKLCRAWIAEILFAVFLAGSTLVELGMIPGSVVGFPLALIACYSVVSAMHDLFMDREQTKVMGFCARYTMPVFLMHTLFAATFRSVLSKVGVDSLILHAVFGLIVSFAGPVIAMIVLEKLRPADIIVYPSKYIRIGKRGEKDVRKET
ncbi:MAG: acyltransferase [Lachnospiraceae bacterium]|nr:acyltransferase [Lachnospiraceae bacterium]